MVDDFDLEEGVTVEELLIEILDDEWSFDGRYKKEQAEGLEDSFSAYYADLRDDGFTIYFDMDWERMRLL